MMKVELLGEMVICLGVALLFGFLIGWLFSNARKKSQIDYGKFDDTFEDTPYTKEITEDERMNIVSLYEKEKLKNKELKGELLQKTHLLTKTTESLREAQTKNFTQQEKNRIVELEKELEKKEKELLEFESVLLKAEQTIERLSTP